jgi:hypothetical protein
MAVSLLPINTQTFGGGGQNAGGRVPDLDPGQDQEPGVVNDALKAAPTLRVIPADEPVARGRFPSGGGEAQGGPCVSSKKQIIFPLPQRQPRVY